MLDLPQHVYTAMSRRQRRIKNYSEKREYIQSWTDGLSIKLSEDLGMKPTEVRDTGLRPEVHN